MTDLVDTDQIEPLVGVARHQLAHFGRADTSDHRIYILHSQSCKDSTPDLRKCEYSRALDAAFAAASVWRSWDGFRDRPMALTIIDGVLVPDPERTWRIRGGVKP